MRKQSILLKRIKVILSKRTTPDGRIDRCKLFGVIAERIGKIPNEEKEALVQELKDEGIIL